MLKFFQKESSVGILLMLAVALSLVFANTPLQGIYDYILETPLEIRLGRQIEVAKPLLLWINDGLMAIFFLLVGLEVKREILIGQLSRRDQVVLPAIAAIGGMVAPALIYVAINAGNPLARNGWAIPAATDIAFALGILALLGDRVPPSLKVFLMALAIMDDLGAIIIIALFYSGDLSMIMLANSVICLLVLVIFNLLQVRRIAPYIWVGAFMWIFVLKSGVHATLAGVALAFTIPLRVDAETESSPLQHLEHGLHPWVSFLILPAFAFANAGISFAELGFKSLLQPVPLGIMLGLVVGKLAGIYGCSLVAIKSGLARLPAAATFRQLFGVAALCGVGFTMSLFIGGLAFEHTGGDAGSYLISHRIGIVSGSLIAGLIGYFILRRSGTVAPAEPPAG